MPSLSHVVECTIPVLPVSDMRRAIQFYIERLGFTLDWNSETVCSVSRDNCHIMLSESVDARGGSWVWIGLEDDSLFHEFKRQGVTVLQEPRNFSWAYEMKFLDVDGNVLWLGTECRSDQPLANEVTA